MAKFRCVCGYQIAISGPVPNPDEWHCRADLELEAISGLVDADDFYQKSTLMYRCPSSGHLWIFWQGLDKPPSGYEPLTTTRSPSPDDESG